MVDISLLEVKRIVEFLYRLDYSDELDEDEQLEECVSPLQLHALMFMNGDRYDIPTLRDMAVLKYHPDAQNLGIPRSS
jgi:hypothetical protein